MRVAILTFGSRGDIQPFIALARALADRGVDPVVGAHPPYREMLEEAGLAFAAVAGDPVDWMRSQTRLAASTSSPAFFREVASFRRKHVPLMRQMLDDSLAIAQSADAIVYSHGALAGPHLASALGLKAAYGGLQPWETTVEHPSMMFRQRPFLPRAGGRLWNRASHYVGDHLVWQPWRGVVNSWRSESLGLPPLPPHVSPWRIDGGSSPHVYGYSALVAPRPHDWPPDRHVTGWWHTDSASPARLDDELEEFLEDGEAPVYIGFGSHVPLDSEQVEETVLRAVRALGRRVVLGGGWADLRLSDELIHPVRSVPHDLLFPRMAAVVQHGGAGTTGAAFRAGVPQVVVPTFFDQYFWAERVKAAGVGPPGVPFAKLDWRRLAGALEATLDEGARRRAADLGARLRKEDGAGRAADLLISAFR